MNYIKNKILIGCIASVIVFTSSYLVFQKYMDLHNNKQTDERVQTKITFDGVSSDQDVAIQMNCKCGDTCPFPGDCYCNDCVGNCGLCTYSNQCDSGSCVNEMCIISGCGCGVESCGACYGCDQADGAECNDNDQCSSGNCYGITCQACIVPGSDEVCYNDGQCCGSVSSCLLTSGLDYGYCACLTVGVSCSDSTLPCCSGYYCDMTDTSTGVCVSNDAE